MGCRHVRVDGRRGHGRRAAGAVFRRSGPGPVDHPRRQHSQQPEDHLHLADAWPLAVAIPEEVADAFAEEVAFALDITEGFAIALADVPNPVTFTVPVEVSIAFAE